MRPGALRKATAQAAAEASTGDFAEYLHYHLDRERQRVHQSRYLNDAIPRPA